MAILSQLSHLPDQSGDKCDNGLLTDERGRAYSCKDYRVLCEPFQGLHDIFQAPSILFGMTMSASGKKNISKASHVVRAHERLEKAVARLDQAISGAEMGQQTGEIDALKAENAKLQESTRAISGRLDQTIGKLKTVLES